jgi:hypothetical protein
MLKRYLELLAQKEVLSQVEIASQLGISLGLVAEMTGQLLRLGYLQAVGGPDCAPAPKTGCADCATHNLCLGAAIQKGWSLTEKGQKTLITP